MEQGFLLNKEEKEKRKEELRQKLKNKINQKKARRQSKPSKKQRQRQIQIDNSHSSENIYNHVLYLMSDLESYKNEKNRLKVAQKFEKKHSFLFENYFNIYREVCYGRLNDLNLLKKLLSQRDMQLKKEQTEEEAATKVGEILTEKFVK